MSIAFIILSSIILFVSIVHFKEYANYKATEDLIAGIAYFALASFGIYCSIKAYEEENPKNTYQAVVYDKFISVNRRTTPYVSVKVNDTYSKVKIDNLYLIDKIQIGDTITVIGCDEEHLRLQ